MTLQENENDITLMLLHFQEVTEVVERLERENESLRSKLDSLGAPHRESPDEEQTPVCDDDGAAACEGTQSCR